MKNLQPLALLLSLLVVGCNQSAPQASALPEQETQAEVTQTAFNVGGAPTIQISVPGMTCEHCLGTVRETLAAQPGVKDVKVELEPKMATVAIDEAQFDAEAAVAALVDLQFSDTKLASQSTASTGASNADSPSENEAPATGAEGSKS